MAAAAVQPPPSAANAFMLETLPDMTKNSETTTQPVTGNKEVALVTSDGGGDAGGAGSSGASGDSHWGDGSIFDNSGRFEADMAVHRVEANGIGSISWMVLYNKPRRLCEIPTATRM